MYGNVPPQTENLETPLDATLRLQYNRAWVGVTLINEISRGSFPLIIKHYADDLQSMGTPNKYRVSLKKVL